MRHNPLWWGFVFPYELLADDGTVLAHVRPDWLLQSVPSNEISERGELCDNGPIDQLYMVLLSSKFTDTDWKDETFRDNISYQDLLLGLFALPTGEPREYRRAGIFFTAVDGPCGREFWDQCGTEEVRLV